MNGYAVDSVGNEASPKTRTVRVIDTTPPFIQLVGASELTIQAGGTFVDPGATAVDSFDGDVVVIVGGGVNPAVEGAYALTYSAQDSSGNSAAPAQRKVTVSGGSSSTGGSSATGGSMAVVVSVDQVNKQVGDTATLVAQLEVPDGSAFYQWFKDDVPLLGENSEVLLIENVTVEDSGAYRVSVVTGNEAGLSAPTALAVRSVEHLPGHTSIKLGAFLVEIFVATEAGKSYQLRSSENLSEWLDDGPPFIGTGEQIRLVREKEGSQQFWRTIANP